MITGAIIFAVAFALGALSYRFILVVPDVKRMADRRWHNQLRNFMIFTSVDQYSKMQREIFDKDSAPRKVS